MPIRSARERLYQTLAYEAGGLIIAAPFYSLLFGRGAEERLSTYIYLDITPKGRNETGPNHSLADWVRHHDRYGDSAPAPAPRAMSPVSRPAERRSRAWMSSCNVVADPGFGAAGAVGAGMALGA